MVHSYLPFRMSIDSLREKRVLKKFKDIGATSPKTAKFLEEVKLTKQERQRLPTLLKQNKLAKTEDGRYYALE